MRDKVVGLENETYFLVAVSVPVDVVVLFGGNSVNLYIAACISVKASDYIQQSGFAAAGRTQNGHEFIIAKFDGNVVECEYALLVHLIFFGNFE